MRTGGDIPLGRPSNESSSESSLAGVSGWRDDDALDDFFPFLGLMTLGSRRSTTPVQLLESAPGEWYPILIDSASLSLGAGFVGTKSSTYSVLSARRVEDWNGGVAELVGYMD